MMFESDVVVCVRVSFITNDEFHSCMKVPDSLKFTGKDKSITGQKKQELINALKKKYSIQDKINKMTKNFSGDVPSVFIGSYGYPSVRTGFLSTDEYAQNDEPLLWSKEGEEKYDIPEIIGLRSSLLNSNINIDVKSFAGRIGDQLKEVSLSSKPVDAEIKLNKKPNSNFSISADRLPHGPSAELKRISVSENPKIPKIVDKVESDTDLKAATALSMLSSKGMDEHYITKILSAGNLGLKKNRKLVPTKWSITATDDSLGKFIAKNKIVFNKEANFEAYFGGYMGNYYIILVFPGPFRYELFETYVGSGLTNPVMFESASDNETAYGRKKYASNTVGGYYACRLAILEHLNRIKRKGSILALRFITDKYWAPLGVWVVREATRKTLASKPLEFSDKERMLRYALLLAKKHYNLDLDVLYGKSNLLKEIKDQKSLFSFI